MKLSKIYSNNIKFKPIMFNPGFNVIYGDVERNQGINEKTGEHNIGKSSLAHLIDFLLLKKTDKLTYFGKYGEKLLNWVFFLEIELNNGKYLTIKRPVTTDTKISFKEHFSRNQNFVDSTLWNYEDLSLNSAKDDLNPKHILESKYLKFNVLSNFSFRSFLPYLLRTQKDYQDIFRTNNFRGRDADWKPAHFEMLGFDAEILTEKYDKDVELKEETRLLKRLVSKSETESEAAIKLAVEAKEREKNTLKSKIDEFDFFQNEQNINFDLVRNIENEIAELNKREYILTHNCEQIRLSLDIGDKTTITPGEIEQLYEEIKVYFPESLSKQYREVINFTSQITKEREKYLKGELDDLQKELGEVRAKLKDLNSNRVRILSVLNERDTFIKYRSYQSELVQIENDIYTYKQKLEGSRLIKSSREAIENIKVKIKELSATLKKETVNDNKDYQNIREIFQDIYKYTFEYTALLVVDTNQSGNVEFEAAVLNQAQNLTGKADGYTSTKVLCASFVLAILIHYSKRSFYRFAYHDGILESWGDNHKIKFIDLVRRYCREVGIQYTISLIKSDLPDGFNFSREEVIRTLSKNDELFGFAF